MNRTSADRIFILGLDGLEYDLIEEWNLVHLKQQEYGKLKVPVNKEIDHPFTPEVWGTFLLGGHAVVNVEEMRHPLAVTLKLLKFLRRHINISLGLGDKVRDRIPAKWWGRLEYVIPSDKKTFLDLTESKAINAPFYNNDAYAFHIMHRFDIGELSLQQTINAYQQLYIERKEIILSEMEKIQDKKVIFAFMHFPDMLEHFAYKRPRIIKKHYLDLDNYILSLKSKVEDSTLFLIVSDHGFNLREGKHSHYGFYSSSQPLNPKPTRITDFFHLILRYTGKRPR